VVRFMTQPLYTQGKSPWYPLDRRLGGPQSRSGRGGEEKNSPPPPGIVPQNSDHPVRSPEIHRVITALKVTLSLSLSKYRTMKTQSLLN